MVLESAVLGYPDGWLSVDTTGPFVVQGLIECIEQGI